MSESLEIYISSRYEPLGIPDADITIESVFWKEIFNISLNMRGSVMAIDEFFQTQGFSMDKNLRILKSMDKMITPKLIAKNIHPIGIELHDRWTSKHPSKHCNHIAGQTDCEFCMVREFLVVFKISVEKSVKLPSAQFLNNRELESLSVKECADIITLSTTDRGVDWNVVGLGDLNGESESFIRLLIANSNE
jgi:hypothetical protein